jgi:hypothetical protein
MGIEVEVLKDVTDQDLTTRPSREPAGRRSERLGFSLRDTRVYRLAGEP